MIAKFMRIRGQSMSPYLNEGDFVFVSGIYFWLNRLKKGDIIILFDPRDNRKLIKRIDHINKNEYYVLGDNRSESRDSRNFGYIEKDYIIAKMIFRIPVLNILKSHKSRV